MNMRISTKVARSNDVVRLTRLHRYCVQKFTFGPVTQYRDWFAQADRVARLMRIAARAKHS